VLIKWFLEVIFWKPFSSSISFLMTTLTSQQRSPFNADFIIGNRQKSAGVGQESTGDAAVLSHCSLLRNPWPKPTDVLAIVMKEKPTVGLPFFRTFPSDCFPNATKDVSVHFFIHSSNSSKSYQWMLGTVWSYYVQVFYYVPLVPITAK